MKHLKPYKIFESNLENNLDIIKDIFTEVTDDWDIDYTVYQHKECVFVDITIDFSKKITPVRDFLKSVFSFVDRVSSHCGLKTNYCMAGYEVPGGRLQRDRIFKNFNTRNQGEYFQIYFTEK